MNLLYSRIQEDYKKETDNEYNVAVPLCKLEPHTNNLLKALYNNTDDVRFKYELLTFPSWATVYPMYKCGNDFYTHIKLKKRFFE